MQHYLGIYSTEGKAHDAYVVASRAYDTVTALGHGDANELFSHISTNEAAFRHTCAPEKRGSITSIVTTPADVLTDVLTSVTADVIDLVSPTRKGQTKSDVTDGTAEVIDLVSPERAVHKKQRADNQAVEAESSCDV